MTWKNLIEMLVHIIGKKKIKIRTFPFPCSLILRGLINTFLLITTKNNYNYILNSAKTRPMHSFSEMLMGHYKQRKVQKQ